MAGAQQDGPRAEVAQVRGATLLWESQCTAAMDAPSQL